MIGFPLCKKKSWIRSLLMPFSWLYGGVLAIRNFLFDLGVFKSKKQPVVTISVGNLSMGGTGKTPITSLLIKVLQEEFHLAVLSRGYGRSSKGFLLATKKCKPAHVGDEILLHRKQLKDQFYAAVCEDRNKGINHLLEIDSKIEMVLLDDAYQHRKTHRDVNLLVTTYQVPFWKDYVVPAGRLREFRTGAKRADAIIINKCPSEISDEERASLQNKAKKYANNIYFASIKYGAIEPLVDTAFYLPKNILLVTGIADPTHLVQHLEKIAPVKKLIFDDHYAYESKDLTRIHEIFDKFAEDEAIIVTTEKDAVKICQKPFLSQLADYPWFVQKMEVQFLEEDLKEEDKFINWIKNVATNKRSSSISAK